MVIDFHTHCFPDKVAEAAMPGLAREAGIYRPRHSGTLASLRETLRAEGADMAVVLPVATNPKQQTRVNDFAIAINDGNAMNGEGILSFGSVHPESPAAFAELERLREAGIRGVKLHPDYQDFFADEPRLFPLYRHIAALGFVTVFHAGRDIGLPDPIHCTPRRLARVLPLFGEAPVVAAHFGGYLCWRDTLACLAGSGVYLDTSYSAGHMPPPWAKEIIGAFGADKILFGSDTPWCGTAESLAFIRGLGLTREQEDLIFYKNAQRLLR